MGRDILEKLKNKSEKEKIKKELYKEYELIKVSNLYNEMDLLRSISNVISSIISLSGLEEQVQIYNRKNLLMLIAVVFGTLGAVVFKFPQDKPFILLCVGGFFLAMFGTLLVDTYSPFSGFMNSYIVPKDLEGTRKFSLKNIWSYNKDAFYITPKIDRASNNIEFLFQRDKIQASRTIYLGKLFTADNYINTDKIFDVVSQLIIEIQEMSKDSKKNK
ncbi:microsomal signal peptidase 25 kDa subunit [Cryptosporidium felis]|nr:microsomal signal peptidase 25 kDa subunit [Cryptosporidium felis]